MTADWTNFRLCFAAAPGGWVRRLAGWVCFHDGSWWVKPHVCDGVDAAPWIKAKTRAGCVRYLARWTLLDIKVTGDIDAASPEWPSYVTERAKRALELGGRLSAMAKEAGYWLS